MKGCSDGQCVAVVRACDPVLHAVLEITYNAVMTGNSCLHRNVEARVARVLRGAEHSAVAALVRLNACPRGAQEARNCTEDSGARCNVKRMRSRRSRKSGMSRRLRFYYGLLSIR